jgi:cAMP-dependent protein kinase regulator
VYTEDSCSVSAALRIPRCSSRLRFALEASVDEDHGAMKLFPTLKRKSADFQTTLEHVFDRFGKKASPKDKAFRQKIEKQAKSGVGRFLDVFNAKVVPCIPDFVAPIHRQTKEESKFIEDTLSGAFLFENLKKFERNALILAFEKCEVAEGTEITKQGDNVEYFYIIQSGTVVQDGDTEDIGSGASFGELALLYDYPSDVTYTAAIDCVLWRLDQVTFRKVMAAYSYRDDIEVKALLKGVTLFKELDDAVLYKIACTLTIETYEKGECIVRNGDECRYFYIVKEGSVEATDLTIGETKYNDLTMKKGDAFGEMAIVRNQPVVGNATAAENVTMLCLPRKAFLKLFGDMTTLITRSQDKKKLVSSTLRFGCGGVSFMRRIHHI